MDIKSSSDRLGPPDVPPIYLDGVVYSQDEDGTGGVLVASDENTGKPLWTLKIYDVEIDKALESDTQWVFFAAMSLDVQGRLRIVNEAGKTFWVDLKARKVSAA